MSKPLLYDTFERMWQNTTKFVDEQITPTDIDVIMGQGQFNFDAYAVTQELEDGTLALTKITDKTITSITIPNNVTSIGDSAFYHCTGLTSITIPNSVTSIGNEAFDWCTGLTSITIPNSVKRIGKKIFSYCKNLTSISVAEGNTTYHSVGNCLIETNTKTLVAGCKTSIIPADGSVTSIGNGAFHYYRHLTDISIPDSVTSIGDYAFYCCSLKNVIIPNSVISIGSHAFYYNEGLTDVILGNSVTSIGTSAFNENEGLTSVVIPESVTSIGDYAFCCCDNMHTITFKGTPSEIGDVFDEYISIINVPWAEGEVANAPWGATNATINYNYIEGGE